VFGSFGSLNDTEPSVLEAKSQEYNCVQKSGDSREFASHTAFRGLLRPSSLRESSHPSLRVFRFGIAR
jgi:hypothetical protein